MLPSAATVPICKPLGSKPPSPNDLPVAAAGLAPLAPPSVAPPPANGAATATSQKTPSVKLLHPLTPAPAQATVPVDPDDR